MYTVNDQTDVNKNKYNFKGKKQVIKVTTNL